MNENDTMFFKENVIEISKHLDALRASMSNDNANIEHIEDIDNILNKMVCELVDKYRKVNYD